MIIDWSVYRKIDLDFVSTSRTIKHASPGTPTSPHGQPTQIHHFLSFVRRTRREKKSRPHLLLFTIGFHQNDFTAPLIVFSSFPINFVLDFRGPAPLRACTNSLTFSADKSISSREQFGCAMFLLFSTICPLDSLARSGAL